MLANKTQDAALQNAVQDDDSDELSEAASRAADKLEDAIEEISAEFEVGALGALDLVVETVCGRCDLPVPVFPDGPVTITQEPTPADHAGWAEQTITFFTQVAGGDADEPEEIVGDLLANLMHLADRDGWDFEAMMRRALRAYNDEVREAARPADDEITVGEFKAMMDAIGKAGLI